MVTICEQCGDKGIFTAFVYCCNCLNNAVHRYCLDVFPKNFDEFVVWYCVDCESKLAKPSNVVNPSSILANISNGKTECNVQEIHCELVLKKKKKKKKKKRKFGATKFKKKHKKRDASDSLAKPKEHTCEDNSPSHLEGHCLENCEREQQKPDDNCSNEVDESVKLKTFKIADDNNSTENIPQFRCSESKADDEKLERHNKVVFECSGKEESIKSKTGLIVTGRPPIAPERSSNDQRQLITNPCCVANGEDIESAAVYSSMVPITSHSSVQGNSSCLVAGSPSGRQQIDNNEKYERPEGNRELTEASSQVTSVEPSIIPLQSYGPAQPMATPVWNGSLSLIDENYGTIGGVVAHLSTLACPKAFEEAKLLPWSLCLELLPRADVWPPSFKKWGPNDDSIALYLFPNNESDEKVYDGLVEDMIKRDLALKAVVTNAELLLFASNLLPFPCRRFQSKLYLWGVFRRKRASGLSNAVVAVPAHANTITWHSRSPRSPLSNSGSYG